MNRLDSRTWLVWGICCMIPMLLARHPLFVVAMLGIVLIVRWVCVPPSAVRWGWIVRIATIFAGIGVIFNGLTVRSGNQIAFHVPVLDFAVTWNAISYGIVSGLAMVTLVLIGITTAAGLDWIALTRVLPQRLAPLAVSGSVAWSFLPAATQSLAGIREAQAARGHSMRSGKDVLPIVVPLLDDSLNRALTMSEVLEARGFGASLSETQTSNRTNIFGLAAIVGALCLAFALSMGSQWLIWAAVVLLVVGVVGFARSPQHVPRATRYREHRLHQRDIVVMIASLASLLALMVLIGRDPTAIVFNPYPDLILPAIDYRLLLALIPLLAPALYPYEESA